MALLGVAVVVVGGAGAAPKKRDRTPPSTPTDLTASSATASTITFTWTASTDNVGVAGYDVTVGSGRSDRVSTTSYTVSGLSCGTTVSVTVAAFDRSQNRSPAATATGSTTGCGDTQAPTAPTDLTVSAPTQNGVTLSWTASQDNVGVVGYYVSVGSTRVGSTATTSYYVGGLLCGASYTLSVVAYDAAENTSTPASTAATAATCPDGGGTGLEPAPIAGQGYSKVWGDEFDAFTPGTWDEGIWYDPGNPVGSTVVQNGVLSLVSRRSQGYPDVTISTETGTTPHAFTLGYFEARMRWTKGAGAWPAFWLLSHRHATNPAWPSINPFCALNGLAAALCYSAELDVFEGQGSEPNVFYGTVHRNSSGDYGVRDSQNANNYQDAGVDLTAGFHTYGMLWTATTISWYLDGRYLHSAPVYDSTNQPQFLLFDMYIGGWTSGTTSQTPDELKTEVDWVRVWQK